MDRLPQRHRRTLQRPPGSLRRHQTTVPHRRASVPLHLPSARHRQATALPVQLLAERDICLLPRQLLPNIHLRLLGGLPQAPRRTLLHLPTLPARRPRLEALLLLAIARRRRHSVLLHHASELEPLMHGIVLASVVFLYYHFRIKNPSKQEKKSYCIFATDLVGYITRNLGMPSLFQPSPLLLFLVLLNVCELPHALT
jgi:hypothetical protein